MKYRLDEESIRDGKFRVDENTGTLFTRSGFEEDVGLSYSLSVSVLDYICLLYTSPSPRDATLSRMPSSA